MPLFMAGMSVSCIFCGTIGRPCDTKAENAVVPQGAASHQSWHPTSSSSRRRRRDCMQRRSPRRTSGCRASRPKGRWGMSGQTCLVTLPGGSLLPSAWLLVVLRSVEGRPDCLIAWLRAAGVDAQQPNNKPNWKARKRPSDTFGKQRGLVQRISSFSVRKASRRVDQAVVV